MHDRLFEVALGITPPWSVTGVQFDAPFKVLSVGIDFTVGSRFAVEGAAGEHPVHDTVVKRYRHLNFFQHECVLEVRTPRVKDSDLLDRRSARLRIGQPSCWATHLKFRRALFIAPAL